MPTIGLKYANMYLRGHAERVREDYALAEKELFSRYQAEVARQQWLQQAIKNEQLYISNIAKALREYRKGGRTKDPDKATTSSVNLLRIEGDALKSVLGSENAQAGRVQDGILAAQEVRNMKPSVANTYAEVGEDLRESVSNVINQQGSALTPDQQSQYASAFLGDAKIAAALNTTDERERFANVDTAKTVLKQTLGISDAQANLFLNNSGVSGDWTEGNVDNYFSEKEQEIAESGYGASTGRRRVLQFASSVEAYRKGKQGIDLSSDEYESLPKEQKEQYDAGRRDAGLVPIQEVTKEKGAQAFDPTELELRRELARAQGMLTAFRAEVRDPGQAPTVEQIRARTGQIYQPHAARGPLGRRLGTVPPRPEREGIRMPRNILGEGHRPAHGVRTTLGRKQPKPEEITQNRFETLPDEDKILLGATMDGRRKANEFAQSDVDPRTGEFEKDSTQEIGRRLYTQITNGQLDKRNLINIAGEVAGSSAEARNDIISEVIALDLYDRDRSKFQKTS